MKARIALIFLAVALVAFGVVLAGKVSTRLDHLDAVAQEGKARTAATPPRQPPRWVHPEPGPESEALTLTGTLKPDADVDLGFKLPGRVLEVRVQRGDVVKAGDVLARLDGRDVEAQAAQARAGMRVAQAQRELARDAWRRSKNLQAAGAASEQQVVLAGGQNQVGEASIAQAEAAGRMVDNLREETRLITPIDGVVVRAPTAPGFFAAPGVPLFRIEKLTRLRFQGHLSDRDAARVRSGGTLTVRSQAGVEATGLLDRIIPSADPATRRVPIEGGIDNAQGTLFAGSFVEATLQATSPTSLKIPASALVTGEQTAVLVVTPEGRLQRRQVRVLRTEKDDLLVRDGLSAQDRVVAAPGREWREGDVLPAAGARPAAAAAAAAQVR